MPGSGASRRTLALMGVLIAVAAIAAYANSFAVPFLFDDTPSILQNQTIRHLAALGTVLSPPTKGGATTSGRPLLNLSLAINYALSGRYVWSYHALNLLVHLLAGLTLFGLVRRTLERLRLPAAGGLACAIALLWTIHPLQAESVTYIVQRAESLAGLFYLLTLYCFVRYAGDEEAAPSSSAKAAADKEAGRRAWAVLSVLACFFGMATKETMVTAPVIVFLYDRTFVSGTFGAAWRRHGRLYLGLAATWILLAWFVLGTGGNRGGSIGFGVGVPWWKYALSQFRAIVTYLRLSVWPHPLIFDYGTEWAQNAADVVPYALIVGCLVAGTLWALRRRPVLGFLGCWFFIILAPTSSIVPGIRQTTAEHRMYLPLAAVLALLVVGVARAAGRLRSARLARGLLLAVAAAAAGGLTLARNHDYRSERAIWTDTVAQQPANGYAHYNLGVVLLQESGPVDAIREFRAAIRIEPRYVEAHNNLGIALLDAGRIEEAIAEYQEALRLRPGFAQAHNNLGNAFAQSGRLADGIAELREALRLQPDYPDAELNLGIALQQVGQMAEAIGRYQRALRLQPDYADAHDDLGNALLASGRVPEAMEQFHQALRLDASDPEAHNSLGNALAESGRLPEAIAQYRAALQRRPAYPEARRNLGDALAEAGQVAEAIDQYRAAIRLRPAYAQAHESLANAFVRSGRAGEAVPEYEEALRLNPADPEAHNNLGGALAQLGRLPEAGRQFEAALRLKPDYADARRNLERLRGLGPPGA
jgi:protein O-mannosyl-transferase